jgi:prepilin-type N-terminal cleavage/methylation domain-containing protein
VRARITGDTRDGGFTLIELMVVTTVFVILMGIAIPNLVAARLRANELSAISHLRSVATAQAQFRQSARADEDFDGQGEYGTFAEMGGRVGVRGLSLKVPTDLTASMSMVDVAGEVQKSGYVFRIYLPKSDGTGLREQPYGGMSLGLVDPDRAENFWACYTWPATNGISGNRTFFMNQICQILHTTEDRRSGQNTAYVRAGDAFQTVNSDDMTGDIAVGTTGSDGNDWVPLN